MKFSPQELIRNLIDALSGLTTRQEDLVGVDITPNFVRLAQLTQSKDSWVLEKVGHKTVLEGASLSSIIEDQEEYVDRLRLLVSSTKLETVNAAVSIPISSAIIRVVTLPLMDEAEIDSAIEYDSLWENVLHLDEKLDEYSVFWQVIQKNPSTNTMELLFVASKLSEINAYTQIVTKAGLNPVIVDVRCFAIRNALKIAKNLSGSSLAIIEFGVHENYMLIVKDDAPFIYDIYLSESDRAMLESGIPEGESGDRFFERYAGQIRQAIRSYESKDGVPLIEKALIVTPIKDSAKLISKLQVHLDGFKAELFDPFNQVVVPINLSEEVESESNSSIYTSALGLATRKMDIFGYYKYVTGVNNVNLLPNRDIVRSAEKKKVISKLGAGVAFAVVLLFLVGSLAFSFYTDQSIESEYQVAIELDAQIQAKEAMIAAARAKKSKFNQILEASAKFKSNQRTSYELLDAVTKSVPGGIWFSEVNFDSPTTLVIKGDASGDQVIVNFIDRLNKVALIEKASLQSISSPAAVAGAKKSSTKQFEVRCILRLDSQNNPSTVAANGNPG